MKNKLSIFLILITASFYASAQVQMDKPLQFTGSGTDAKISGIQDVSASNDAVNVQAIQQNSLIYANDAGSANAYAVNLSPAVGSYTAGMVVNFKAANANTGASTINVNGLGNVAIKKLVTTDL